MVLEHDEGRSPRATSASRSTEAVITVPAYFDDAQRQATKDAGKHRRPRRQAHHQRADGGRARLRARRRTRARAHRRVRPRRRHVRHLDPRDRRTASSSVRATNGDTYLGGEDFDHAHHRLPRARSSRARHGIDLREDRMALQRLKEPAEKAKHELSSSLETEINLPFIAADASGPEAPRRARSSAASSRSWSRIWSSGRSTRARKALKDAGLQVERHRRGGPRRRHDAHAAGARSGERVLRQRAAQGREPGRGRRRRRRDPGRRALGRGRRGAAARRDAALARRRDRRRRVHAHHPAQHHHPHASAARSSRPASTTSRSCRSTCCRASARWPPTTRRSRKFELTGIPPAPRGVPQIEVTLRASTPNGIVHVAANDLGTGKQSEGARGAVERPDARIRSTGSSATPRSSEGDETSAGGTGRAQEQRRSACSTRASARSNECAELVDAGDHRRGASDIAYLQRLIERHRRRDLDPRRAATARAERLQDRRVDVRLDQRRGRLTSHAARAAGPAGGSLDHMG